MTMNTITTEQTRRLLIERARKDPRFLRALKSLDRDYELGIRNPNAFYAHTDGAYGTVLTAPSPALSGNSLTLNSGEGSTFPSAGHPIAIGASSWNRAQWATGFEGCIATRIGDVFTLVRAAWGPGLRSRSIVVGDVVIHGPVANDLSVIESYLANIAAPGVAILPLPYCFYDNTLGVDTTTITIPASGAIPAGFSCVEIKAVARGDTGSNVAVQMRFNGDSSANYDTQAMFGFGSTVGAAESYAGTAAASASIPAATDVANSAGILDISIPAYAGTTFHKVGLMKTMRKLGTTTGNNAVLEHAFAWRSTAAITTVTLTLASGKFVAGSRFTAWVK